MLIRKAYLRKVVEKYKNNGLLRTLHSGEDFILFDVRGDLTSLGKTSLLDEQVYEKYCGKENVLLNFRRRYGIDTSGLANLMEIAMRLSDCNMGVCGYTTNLERVMDINKLYAIFRGLGNFTVYSDMHWREVAKIFESS